MTLAPPNELRFFVPGPPVAKQRPRVGKGGRVYTPGQTASYEERVALVGMVAVGHAGISRWPTVGHFGVSLWMRFRDRRRRDLDNVAKSVLDALNGVAYDDDSLVDELHVYREHSTDRPGVVVCVRRRPK